MEKLGGDLAEFHKNNTDYDFLSIICGQKIIKATPIVENDNFSRFSYFIAPFIKAGIKITRSGS